MYDFFYLFLLFLIYSVFGYIVEVSSIYINYNKLSFHRGFLLGPYLPVFGIGGILMNLLLNKYLDDPLALFCTALILCSLIEYLSSLVLEKIFKLRWWDYKDKKFNINGRICLENAIGFGLAGMMFLKFINPFLLHLLNLIPHNILIVISLLLFILFILDLAFTINSLCSIRIDFDKYLHKDATAEVKQKIQERLKITLFGTAHIFKAFPKSTYLDNSRLNKFKDQLFEIRKERKLKKLKEKNKLLKKIKRDF